MQIILHGISFIEYDNNDNNNDNNNDGNSNNNNRNNNESCASQVGHTLIVYNSR